MGSWTIYNKNGVAKAIVKELELHDEWMAECFLTVTINSATPIQFGVGDYLDYRGERYTIEYDPNVIKRATSGTYGEGFVYDGIKFVGSQDEIVRCDFNDIVLSDNLHYTGLPTFPFYCESVDDLLDRIQANLEDLYPNQWIVIGLNTVRNSQRGSAVGRQTAFENAYKKWIDPDMTPHTDPYGKQSVAESADNITCWDALAKVHEDFGLNFIVRGKVIVVGTAGVFTANTFRYGKGNGLTEIEKVGDSSQQIVTRLRAYGSETNLPLHYYSAINMRPYGNVVEASATGIFQIDVDFDTRYFIHGFSSGETDIAVQIGSTTYSAKAYNNTTTGKININVLTAISVAANTKVYITEGVKRDMWPSDHKDYTQDALPENMAVSRLMLPMFPNTSLYDWVKAHRDAGTEYDDTTGLATYHGFTAYFSKEPHRPYIDSLNKAQYGVRPASIYFDGSNETDDIHPTIEGMTYNNVRIDAVYSADQISDSGVYDDSSIEVPNFHITLPDLGFNLAEVYEENASIDMKDGMCGGRSFKFASKPTQDSNGRWVCEVQRDKDENLNLFFPYCDFQITSGDHYVLTGIQMPDAYIEAAAIKLLGAALDALQKNEAPRFTYQPKIDKNFMQRQHDTASASQSGVSLHDTLKAGDVFVFADADMGIDASIIIDVLTIKENGDNGIPTYEITLRDEKQVSTIQKIQNKIDSVINGAININSGVGGLTAQQVRSLINNYGGEQFLSKLNDDTAAGYITMLKGLQVGANFVPDILGEGGVLRMRDDGKVELVTDMLYARVKAYFDSVEIREYQHTGGNRIASVAGNRMCRVEWYDANNQVLEQTQANLSSVAYFRCYFRAEDDETEVKNNWVVGDMAYCHVTSITNSSDNPEQKGLNQKHLWRLVIGRNTEGTLTEDGEAYIDLSNRATETISGNNYTGYQSGSDIPEAQDDIIQLGNVNDTTRQGAIVEFVTGTDAPSYQIYQGINSFSLSGKNQIGFGYNTGTGRAYLNVFGDFRFGARPNTSGSYLEYNSQTGALNIKAHVEFTNSDQELDSLVQSHQRDDSYDDTEVRGLINGLQEQIDGQIETWFYNYSPVNVDASGAPTSNVPLNVAPYSDWTTDNDKIAHLGDTFTNNSTGYCWRFSRNSSTNAFEWVIIEDSAVITALQNAARAQDTADHKRRVFICDSSHQTPTPPYDAGDLWVNVKYPWATGATYNDEILKCVTSKASGSFAIADWSLANGYTAKLNNFVNNTYAPFTQNIQTQVDKKAETWRQATNPASSWATESEKAKHVGDLWMDTANGKKTYIYQNTAASGQTPVYEWVAQDVPDEVFDKIDGKAAIYVGWEDWIVGGVSQLKDKDLYIPNTDHNPYKANKVYRWKASDSTWNEISYTDDTAFNNYINAFLNGTGASGDSATAAAIQKAIAGALGSGTIVDGGLLLTSLIAMRKNVGTTESPVYETWAGISGQYDDWSGNTHAKGHGIAAWYGGAMVDKEDVQTLPASYAKSLFRFDGSGYLADGNITWTASGSMTIRNLTTIYGSQGGGVDVNTLSSLTSIFHTETYGTDPNTELLVKPQNAFGELFINRSGTPHVSDYTTDKSICDYSVLNFGEMKSRFVTKDFFARLFQAFNGSTAVDVNDLTTTIDNIKAMVDFWSQGGITALGQGSGGGGGGGSTTLYGLNDVTENATHDGVYGAADGYVLTYNASTNHWYAAATAETYVLPQATSGALGGIKIGYSASGKNYPLVLNNNGQAYINVPWENTTYTLAGLMGSSVIGGTTQPIYWNGSAFANTTYTLGKSVPSDAVFTDTTYSNGTGLALSSGTFSINSTYQTYISHGESAYNSLSSYLPLTGGVLANASYESQLTIKRTTDNDSVIKFENSSGYLGSIGIGSGGSPYFTPDHGNSAYSLIHSNNIGSQSVNYASSAGSVAWSNVSNRPTALSSFINDSGYITSSGSCNYATSAGSATYASYLDAYSSITFNGKQLTYGYLSSSSDTAFTDWLDTYGQITYISIPFSNTDYGAQLMFGINSSNVGYRKKVNGTWSSVFKIITSENISSQSVNYANSSGNSSLLGGYGQSDFLHTTGGSVSGNVTISGKTKSGSFEAGLVEIPSGQNIIQTTSNYTLYINYSSTGDIVLGAGGGSVTVSHNITANGGVTALSDARHKQVIRDINLSVEQIANMPSVIFKWTDGKHDNNLHVGTLAQNWKSVLPELVLEAPDKEHTLSLSYGVAALVSAITTARKVVDHEARIKALEKENRELKEELNRLKIA